MMLVAVDNNGRFVDMRPSGSSRYCETDEAKVEVVYRDKIKVVRVQNGPLVLALSRARGTHHTSQSGLDTRRR